VRLRSVDTGRLLCFDLENRPLAYWYDGETTSEITAFGWKWSDEDVVHTMLLRADGWFDVSDDCAGHAELPPGDAYWTFREILGEASVVYGHNIRRHDLPMLNAGLIRRELPPLPRLLTTDTCRDLPRTGGVSKSLENMAAMYGLEGEKFTMSQPAWENANRLTDGGRALAAKRVASDVLLQERLRARLLSLGILGAPRGWP
jgi:hypothetical protein